MSDQNKSKGDDCLLSSLDPYCMYYLSVVGTQRIFDQMNKWK